MFLDTEKLTHSMQGSLYWQIEDLKKYHKGAFDELLRTKVLTVKVCITKTKWCDRSIGMQDPPVAYITPYILETPPRYVKRILSRAIVFTDEMMHPHNKELLQELLLLSRLILLSFETLMLNALAEKLR